MHKDQLHLTIFNVFIIQIKRFWFYYFLAFSSLIATHYILSFLPFLAKDLTKLIKEGATNLPTSEFLLLALGIIIVRTSSRLLFFYPARIMQKEMRVEVLRRVEDTLPLRYSSYSPGQLFQIMFNDIDNVRALFGFVLLQVSNIIIAMIILIPKLMSFNTTLVWALIPLFAVFFIFSAIVWSTHYDYRMSQQIQGDVQNLIMESYVGKSTIKNFSAEQSFMSLFSKKSWEELTHFHRAGIKIAISKPLIPLGVGLSFIFGALIIKDQALGAEGLILFSGFVFLFLEPMMFLSWISIVFTRFLASWRRIKILISNLDQSVPQEDLLKELNHNITDANNLNVCVNFWEKNKNFKFRKNSWSSIIGSTGCGKSELLKKIAMVLNMFNRKLSYVGQAPYLYNDTVLGNIFLGEDKEKQDHAIAYELLKLFGLDYLAQNKDELLYLDVGEHGKRLSGGQAKRLCLVRSILSNSDYLLWDDPFSSIDVILEKQIVNNLKSSKLLIGKTVIFTTHRLSSAKFSDDVILIDKEKGIVEQGEMAFLLKEKSKVYDYFKKQLI